MPRSVGRPTKYRKAYCNKIIEWGKQGKLPCYWCRELGVGQSSLARWKQEHEEFRVAYEHAMDCQAAYELDLLDKDPSAVQLNIAKWKLSAYHKVSETTKQEIKQEVNAKIETVEVSFGDEDEL